MNKYLTERQIIQHRQRVLRDSEKYGVTKAARMYGIHRSTIYEWRKNIVPRKKGPQDKVPWQTSQEMEEKVIEMKKRTNYGPKRIKQELKIIGIELGEKAIRGVLERNGLVKKQKKKRKKKQRKFYAPYPGYRIQIDTKVVPDEGIDLRSGKRYQFTAIDTASKIRFLMIYEELSNFTTLDFLKRVIAFYTEIGINIETIQTDNHSTFTNLCVGGNKKKDHQLLRVHSFTQHCLNNNIEHLLSRPGTPQDNCFVERSHRTDDEEFYSFLSLSQMNNTQLQQAINDWTFNYNFLRLHSSCNYQTPFQFLSSSVWTTGA